MSQTNFTYYTLGKWLGHNIKTSVKNLSRFICRPRKINQLYSSKKCYIRRQSALYINVSRHYKKSKKKQNHLFDVRFPSKTLYMHAKKRKARDMISQNQIA